MRARSRRPTGADGIARADHSKPASGRSARAPMATSRQRRPARAARGRDDEARHRARAGRPHARRDRRPMRRGGPIAGARIDAAKLGGARAAERCGRDDSDGRRRAVQAAVAEGQLIVAASEPSYSPQSRLRRSRCGGRDRRFSARPRRRDRRRRARRGHRTSPLPGPDPRSQRDAPGDDVGERARRRVTTDADGRFRIAGLRPGAYNVGAHGPKLASKHRRSSVSASPSRSPMSRSSSEARRCSGHRRR